MLYIIMDYYTHVSAISYNVSQCIGITFSMLLIIMDSQSIRQFIKTYYTQIIWFAGITNIMGIMYADAEIGIWYLYFHTITKSLIFSVIPLVYKKSDILFSMIICLGVYTVSVHFSINQYIALLSQIDTRHRTNLQHLINLLFGFLICGRNIYFKPYLFMIFAMYAIFQIIYHMSLNYTYSYSSTLATFEIYNALIDTLISIIYLVGYQENF